MPITPAHVSAVRPYRAIEGGRITIAGGGFDVAGPNLPEVHIDGRRAQVVYASSVAIGALVPSGIVDGGRVPVRIDGVSGATAFVDVATPFATGLHQVDNPVFDSDGNLFVTYSGTRGQQVPVSIFRVPPDGTRETFSSAVVNPTSMAIDPQGRLHVSSRFAGTVYRIAPDGTAEVFASDLGIACGLAFAPDGTLFVGDRSGTIFKVSQSGDVSTFASLPPSVAAFHLALAPDGTLFVTGPTLSSYDVVYQIDKAGNVTVRGERFGRPQGLAFDASGALFVVEALAGVSGLYRLPATGEAELVLSGPGLVGVAFDRQGTLVVCSNETAYRLPPRPDMGIPA
jgi:sugar lactone lactonase YvrE